MSNLASSRVTPLPRQAPQRDTGSSSAQHTVPLPELLTDSFVRRHTRFGSVDALLEAGELHSGWRGNRGIVFGRDWDLFIRSVSRHADWTALLREAGAEWQMRRIGLVIDA